MRIESKAGPGPRWGSHIIAPELHAQADHTVRCPVERSTSLSVNRALPEALMFPERLIGAGL